MVVLWLLRCGCGGFHGDGTVFVTMVVWYGMMGLEVLVMMGWLL